MNSIKCLGVILASTFLFMQCKQDNKVKKVAKEKNI
ncbi:hypothetical protein CLV91_2337 [Maribacter vaceletii]|uniref:Uncharacterized protein n=1 Tax=Maribacter vaceletii TaxID=1206816 RepID=A0A495E5K1_9FLAO|nr:hypothetical protein CLV91_2337 [Maribacter vaceletii]